MSKRKNRRKPKKKGSQCAATQKKAQITKTDKKLNAEQANVKEGGDYTQRFNEACQSLPPPGHGQGLHAKLLGAANLGVLAKMSDEDIFKEIRTSINPGNREVPDQEITEAIEKARGTCAPGASKAPVASPEEKIKNNSELTRSI